MEGRKKGRINKGGRNKIRRLERQKEGEVCACEVGDIKDYQYHSQSPNGERNIINLSRLSDLITICPLESYD